ncbi:MAG: hypothetical protein M0R06_15505 [Sphaerochaeta sp.]|jgi:hypothetical protein|nr:hypothetical protein [Sphaerochaeta sp.]
MDHEDELLSRAHDTLRALERHSAVVKWAVAALYLEAGCECLSDCFAYQAARHEANAEQ